jgi:hypothetical protein
MVTEYIKRGQKMGYDTDGKLVYKVLATETTPAEPVAEEDEEVSLFDE